MSMIGKRIAAIIWMTFSALAGALRSPATAWLDQQKMHDAMRQEILSRIREKAEKQRQGIYLHFDYLTEEAYASIKERINAVQNTGDDLDVLLSRILGETSREPEVIRFQKAVNNFILGMTIEINDYLEKEYTEVTDRTENIRQLNQFLENDPDPTTEAIAASLQKHRLPASFLKRCQTIERRWEDPDGGTGPDSYRIFRTLRKNVMGSYPDQEQELAFQLGDKYREEYSFIDDFLALYRQAADEFLKAVRRTLQIMWQRNIEP